MKHLLLVALFSALVAVVISASPPTISETFTANTIVSFSYPFFNITGKGVWSADQPKGKSLESTHFGPNHPYNVWTLSRYDLHQYFETLNAPFCTFFPLEGEMPEVWGWVKSNEAKYSTTTFDGHAYDTWSITLGYATISVLVSGTTPVLFKSHSETRDVTIQFTSWATTITNSSTFDVPSDCHAIVAKTGVGCVSRSTMISRAQNWVNNHVPYNQGGDYAGYREDCSGYVSMAWEAAKPGYTTFTLHEISHPITKSELTEGDVLLCASEHVVLFGGWTDSTKSHYVAFEETRPGEGTVRRVTPYPYWYNTACFKPYRYNSVC
eukprot:TRINITY_DN11952_c0_g1_i1.p1 TRINITY_DN11952_c0_g1~~TRINITY_DN11952_c0_g1_i1.p1  ORF type:complete len:323 (+),score=66.29 TRINITY_DN11952_c0_g1_i1:136-1104(+)